ncbi:hypothetical protein IL306_004918 [Fusarium sp. DS 682]|nr:hypothetical protein IL306_004918 [Fusarium sp. DS 682]
MDETLSDLVRDYKLVTRHEGVFTIHFHSDPDAPPSSPCRQERWRKVRTLGRGGQGEVVLQTCIEGGRNLTERAVKRIRLQNGYSNQHYKRELESIVKFSHDRNILIYKSPQGLPSSSWWVKLADFGISKKLNTETNFTTLAPGTPLYMAPELLRSETRSLFINDYRTADVWAVGITTFFMLTKNVPFRTQPAIMDFTGNLDEIIPHNLLAHCQLTESGQAFINQLLEPQVEKRLDAESAKLHPWVHHWLPEVPASSIHSR